MSAHDASPASLPPFAREVLELYATALAEVRFPDIDLTVLERCADELRESQEEVERLDTELRAAQERLHERSSLMLAKADRALAYARVYAEDDPTLSARVSAILGQTTSPAANEDASAPTARKRGKQRKATSTSSSSESQAELAELPAEMAAED